jgi:hypothetical protein
MAINHWPAGERPRDNTPREDPEGVQRLVAAQANLLGGRTQKTDSNDC